MKQYIIRKRNTQLLLQIHISPHMDFEQKLYQEKEGEKTKRAEIGDCKKKRLINRLPLYIKIFSVKKLLLKK